MEQNQESKEEYPEWYLILKELFEKKKNIDTEKQ